MDKQLPARPHLDHLRGQAKALLAQLKAGDAAAARAFAEHLPAARGLKPAALRAAGFRLADAQSVVARQSGFASWPVLARHVEQLRGLEGEWRIASLEVDGHALSPAMLAHSRILMDGDRFRTESPEGTYEGIFTIDAEASPPRIDIHFIAGPEAGNWSYGIYRLDGPDQLTLCLGLTGAARPQAFVTRAGSGHALEQLHRTSAARPADVTGGTPPPPPAPTPPSAPLDAPPSALLARLQGEWTPVELMMDGKPMPPAWLASGSRTMTGSELKVVFGGQTMVHADVRIDDRITPIAIDYIDRRPKTAGTVTHGILEFLDDQVRFLMSPAGHPRPTAFTAAARGTLTRWRRRA